MGGNQRPRERRTPSNPIQGDDLFRTRSQQRQNAPFFTLNADDGDDFWSNLDERHTQHRQHLTWLVVAFVVVVILGLIIDTVLIGFALFILIPIGVEAVMIRRTRSRSKIPDYRRPEPAEIDLEPDA